MLTAHGVRIAFGPHEVLRGIDWGIPPGSRWGLVGVNGSGKTTLLKILAGLETPDAGSVDRPGKSTVAYLPQEGGDLREGTLLQAILAPFTEIAAMEAEIERLHHELAAGVGPPEVVSRRLGEVQHRFEAAGGFRLEAEARAVLTGLGFEAEDYRRDIREFSGGYRTRALLGSLLLRRPDYLLLDEPTNHLDLEGISWLESYLPDLPSAVVIVSHDRLLLNRLAGSIAELERGVIRVFRGNYDRYRVESEAIRARARAAAAREEKRIAQVQRFIDRYRYDKKRARQVQDRIRMLEKQERTEVPPEETTWRFRFPAIARPPRRIVELRRVSKSFGDASVLRHVDLTVERGERVAVVGPNGCGKTTLLKVAAGLLPADGGDVDPGEGVVGRYAAQHLLETFTPGRTVLEELEVIAPMRRQGELRSLLGILQFSGDDVFKSVEALSGGEKNRLALARLVLDPGNFLLLDEPTNHLDLLAREALEEALVEYEGAVIFASHDRYFINRVAHKVAGFESGRVVVVEGGYDAWQETVRRARERGSIPEPAAPRERAAGCVRPSRREERRAAAEARNARNRALRELREKVASLEKAIEKSEARLDEIAAALSDTATYRTEGLAESLGREQKSLSAELSDLMRRWERASAELHAAEAAL